ncbi:hypothetical protein [Bdellovibrio svalbardensis]|uniref:Uncharacterized protein n=1 Tax=Bdellovibrio svalbardensis TaxID=2972972 RepID=A0ABT6DIT5_9BACT|nr:hypothetical protein [Bdellovibrio svalbardensis]MDG0816747.1 hypothetical protein [Bdellovibrio svalbardensis]
MRMAKFGVCVSLMTLMAQIPALAICDKNLERCGTVAAGVGVATGSGIYALSKFKAAKAFEKGNTEVVMDVIHNPQRLDNGRISRLASALTEGDRVKVVYRLSESANRDHHVASLESQAASEVSQAASYNAQAIDALVPKYETVTEVVNGNHVTRQVLRGPDLSSHLRYIDFAEQSEAEAKRLYARAADAKHGGKVPWYEFTKEVDEPAGTQNAVSDFLNKHAAEGGSVLKITRLEAGKLIQLKKMIWKARGGVAGVAAAGAFAAEEAVAGKVAESLAKKSNGVR